MSFTNLKAAWDTKLGNLAAKSVLVLIVDQANADGLAFVGLDRVVKLTEISKRTGHRMVQVFTEINLVNRTKGTLKGRLLPAFQVNLERLGLDLAREFTNAYRQASRKCLKDIDPDVSGSTGRVSETQTSVSTTNPPYPLKGMSPLVPFLSHSPQPPRAEGVSKLDRAVEQVCSALGISNGRVRKRVESAIALAMEKGDPAEKIAVKMLKAVQDQDRLQARSLLKFKYGLPRFLGEGIWADDNRWAWNPEEARLQAEARLGTFNPP